MSIATRRLLFGFCSLVVALPLAFGRLEAKPSSSPPRGLREEVAELRAEIAKLRATIGLLESRVEFQGRRDAAGGSSGITCGDPCASDADGDGLNDCEDPCPCDPLNGDGDGDGALDCYDPCPDDPTDACIDPCRMDSDGDGTNDCQDPCPYDPQPPADSDGDGIPDCQDPCPDDPSNQCTGPCPPLDQDGDGVLDCVDPCPLGEGSGAPCATPTTGASGAADPGE